MKINKLKHSLSIKLLKIIFSTYLLITALTLTLQLYFQYNSTKVKVKNEIVSIEDKFKDSLSAAVWNFSVEEINSILKGIHNNQYILGVKLLDKNSIVLNQKGDLSLGQLEYSFTLNRNYKGEDLLIGKLEIYSDPNIVFNKFKESVFFIVQNTFVVFSILSFVLLVIFYKYLTKPLNKLTEALEGLNLENLEECKILKENIDLDKHNKDELELFKSSFIVMANKILSSSKELHTLNTTLEKKVEQRTLNLKSEKDKLKTFLDAAMEAIFISKEGVCIDVNQSAVEMFGYNSKDEMVGKKLLTFVAPESIELVKEKLAKHDCLPYEGLVQRKNKNKFFAYLRGVNVHTDKKMRVSSVVDISHLKQLESQAKLAAMGEMIGNIAHQWRQPLSIISTGATGVAIKMEFGDYDEKEIVQICNQINENAQYLSQTIDDFRNFIRGDSTPVNFNLQNDTDSFIKLVNSSIKEHNIKLILDFEEYIELKGYPNELIQCFMNIFHNSKDAFLENGIDEDERYLFISQYVKNNKIHIIFKDNAGGIPEDIINKIFDPYFTTKHQSQGTGIGLHMTYNLIVNSMKGTIEVSNDIYELDGKKYKGAKFEIILNL